MAWTIDKVQTHLEITPDQARTVLGLVRGSVDPFSLPGVDAWRQKCYHTPERGPEAILKAIDEVLEAHGTEAIWGNDCLRPIAEYVNMGDTYAATVLYDRDARKFRLTTLGDYVETYETETGITIP